MCGIAGFLSREVLGQSAELENRLRKMIGPISHRGPDGVGTWSSEGRVGLAHARLAIIDLSVNANQPMLSTDGEACITYNGEIYNFRTLRSELEGLGHRFRTHSDTETILVGYRQWGDDIVDRLRGMFAFSLWDSRRRRMLLARDPIGEKPLIYADVGHTLIFGSAIRALTTWPGFHARPDLGAIDQYLRRVYVPTPMTAFEGVFKLPPGSIMSVESSGQRSITRYWKPSTPKSYGRTTRHELKQEMLRRIDKVVADSLVSDVPLGAFLSGGVDSSAIVASMTRVSDKVKTFTVGFAENTHDEREFARTVAKHLGTEHHEIEVTPDAASLLPQLAWHYSEPFADSSALPSYYLSAFARQHVTVALSGDGGDESFAGYPMYFAFAAAGISHALLPRWMARSARSLGHAIDPTHTRHKRLSWACRILGTDGNWANEYSNWTAPVDEMARRRLYGDALLEASNRNFNSLDRMAWSDLRTENHSESWLEHAIRPAGLAACADMNGWLPDQLLVKMDVASMAHGLEVRAPLLNRDLIDFAATIPQTEKMRGLQTKSLLKEALEERIPRSTLHRKKRGFQVPVARWLRTDLREMMHELLLGTSLRDRELLNITEVERLIGEHHTGRHNHANRLWGLMMLELWYRTWIDS